MLIHFYSCFTSCSNTSNTCNTMQRQRKSNHSFLFPGCLYRFIPRYTQQLTWTLHFMFQISVCDTHGMRANALFSRTLREHSRFEELNTCWFCNNVSVFYKNLIDIYQIISNGECNVINPVSSTSHDFFKSVLRFCLPKEYVKSTYLLSHNKL